MSSWLDLQTSIDGLVHKFITTRNSLTNQAIMWQADDDDDDNSSDGGNDSSDGENDNH